MFKFLRAFIRLMLALPFLAMPAQPQAEAATEDPDAVDYDDGNDDGNGDDGSDDDVEKPRFFSITGYNLLLDVPGPDKDGIEQALRDRGFTLPEPLRGGGGGLLLTLGRFVLDGYGSGLGGQEGGQGYGYGLGAASVGIALVKSRHFRLFPLVEVGGANGMLGSAKPPAAPTAAEPATKAEPQVTAIQTGMPVTPAQIKRNGAAHASSTPAPARIIRSGGSGEPDAQAIPQSGTGSAATPNLASLDALWLGVGLGLDVHVKLLVFRLTLGLRAGYRVPLIPDLDGEAGIDAPVGPFLRVVVGSGGGQ